jgi:hypothetical protein
MNIDSSFAQTTSTISLKDFKLFEGNWNGSLTYMDYSSNKPYTMPANINVKQIRKTNQLVFLNTYPDEPKANSADTITISKDGKMLNKETVKSIQKLGDGNTEIITETTGVDGNDNKPALLRHIYIVGKKKFVIRKEVQFVGQTEWLKRHEYNYTKK